MTHFICKRSNRTNSIALLICISANLLVPSPAAPDVWRATNQWTEEWENRYSAWIAREIKPDFLTIIPLKVDCADFCYVIRAIFSRIHFLPFMASNADGQPIGHYSDGFDSLKTSNLWYRDDRFKAFLSSLVKHVTTKSYPYDTYPVELSPRTVKPGLVIYENLIASHACMIGRVDPTYIIPVVFYEATVPPDVRFKETTALDIYIYTPNVPSSHSGVVRWNWPVQKNNRWQLVPDEQMPYYSKEIYDASFPYRTQLSRALNRAVKIHSADGTFDSEELMQKLVHFFQNEIEFRAKLILQAEALLKQQSSVKSESFEFNYGTESRDNRLYELMRQIWKGLREYDLPRDRFFRTLETIPVRISSSTPYTNLLLIFIAVDQRWISPDAYEYPEKRWGLYWDRDSNRWYFMTEEGLIGVHDLVKSYKGEWELASE